MERDVMRDQLLWSWGMRSWMICCLQVGGWGSQWWSSSPNPNACKPGSQWCKFKFKFKGLRTRSTDVWGQEKIKVSAQRSLPQVLVQITMAPYISAKVFLDSPIGKTWIFLIFFFYIYLSLDWLLTRKQSTHCAEAKNYKPEHSSPSAGIDPW